MSIVKNQYGGIDLPATVEALHKRITAIEAKESPQEEDSTPTSVGEDAPQPDSSNSETPTQTEAE